MIVAPACISGSAARVHRNVPVRFVSKHVAPHLKRGFSTVTTGWVIPALFTSTSILPKRCLTAANSAPTDFASRTSHAIGMIVPALASLAISAALFVSVGLSRPVMTTVQPSAARARAMAKPIPRLPPVTTATLPSSRNSLCAGLTDRVAFLGLRFFDCGFFAAIG